MCTKCEIQLSNYAANASQMLGKNVLATFSDLLLWQIVYPWPHRPAELVDAWFTKVDKSWLPIIDVLDEASDDVCSKIQLDEDLHNGFSSKRFSQTVDQHRCACFLCEYSRFLM